MDASRSMPSPSSGLACLPSQKRWPGTYVYASEAAVTAVLLGIGLGFNAMPPWTIPFLERDPALSYAVKRPETIPAAVLIAVSLLVPACVIITTHALRCCHARVPCIIIIKSGGWQALALAQTFGLCLFATNLIKFLMARPRPNFYGLCNYAGFSQGISTGNMTAYNAATTPGAFGDIARCSGPTSDIYEAQRSFVSGHASISFCAMMFTTHLLRLAFGVARASHLGVMSAIAAAPLLGAGWIAISRVRDRWHNTDDVALGALVGLMSAHLAWAHYVAHKRAGHTAITDVSGLADEIDDVAGRRDSSAMTLTATVGVEWDGSRDSMVREPRETKPEGSYNV